MSDFDTENQEPTIYDVVELPESEKAGECPRYIGDDPSRCNKPVQFVFVYEANMSAGVDQRRNCLCCSDCKPCVTGEDPDPPKSTDWEKCPVCGGDGSVRQGWILGECSTCEGDAELPSDHWRLNLGGEDGDRDD